MITHDSAEGPLRMSTDIPQGDVDFTSPYAVKINKVENGFVVSIGCKTFVSESFKNMVGWLEKYFKDPKITELAFYKKYDIPRTPK